MDCNEGRHRRIPSRAFVETESQSRLTCGTFSMASRCSLCSIGRPEYYGISPVARVRPQPRQLRVAGSPDGPVKLGIAREETWKAT